MDTQTIPTKTAAGFDELASRARRLSQRHRTVLLLVDGKRTVAQVLALAEAAGVEGRHFQELVDMGLIAGAALPGVLPAGEEAESPVHVDLPLEPVPIIAPAALPAAVERGDSEVSPTSRPTPLQAEASTLSTTTMPGIAPRPPGEGAESSFLPPVRSLLPDSVLSDFGELPTGGPFVDRPLEEAREILLRAVKAEAPVTGQLTMIRLRRAASRAELEALLDEVEARIAKPRKMIVAAQTLRHVRHLLGMPANTSFTLN